MIRKRALSVLIAGMLLSMQVCVFAQDNSEVKKATISKTGVNEQARLEAYKEYTAPEAERNIDIVPLFDDWSGKEAFKKVNNIGNKLLLSNNIDDFVRFEVSRKMTVNAYANHEGVVHVYKGLLDYVENEDELAFVIGHEIAHITYDDTKRNMIRKGLIIAAAAAGGVAVGAGSGSGSAGGATAGGVLAGGKLANNKMNRGVEARADISGIDYMVKAGYNPLGAISMINKIMDRRWDGMHGHPSGDKRLMKAYQHIVQKYPKYLAAGFDTISYERAMTYIDKKLSEDKAEIYVKQNSKSHKKQKTIIEDNKQ